MSQIAQGDWPFADTQWSAERLNRWISEIERVLVLVRRRRWSAKDHIMGMCLEAELRDKRRMLARMNGTRPVEGGAGTVPKGGASASRPISASHRAVA